jgi:hypothetical protein
MVIQQCEGWIYERQVEHGRDYKEI